MKLSAQIAKHMKDVHFGGNWTVSNLKDMLADVTWQEATTQVYSMNTMATLVYHIHYFVAVASKVLEGEALNGKDEYSFAHPPIHSKEDWDNFVHKVLAEAEMFTTLIAHLPDDKLMEDFADKKYGNYYRNLHGIIEHTHYHLGQISLIKKIIRQQKASNP